MVETEMKEEFQVMELKGMGPQGRTENRILGREVKELGSQGI